jgi:predicted  nucleic acid-binding Zn-ribbon protein
MATAAPEKLSKGKVLAGLLRQLDEVRDDRKEAMAAYKKDEQRLQNEIRRLAGDIETGQNELFDVTDETEETELQPPQDVAEKIADVIDGTVITLDSGATATITKAKKGRKK